MEDTWEVEGQSHGYPWLHGELTARVVSNIVLKKYGEFIIFSLKIMCMCLSGNGTPEV